MRELFDEYLLKGKVRDKDLFRMDSIHQCSFVDYVNEIVNSVGVRCGFLRVTEVLSETVGVSTVRLTVCRRPTKMKTSIQRPYYFLVFLSLSDR